MINAKETQDELNVFIQNVKNGHQDTVDIVTSYNEGEFTRTLDYDGEVIRNSVFGRTEPICKGIVKEHRDNKTNYRLAGCNNSSWILEINMLGN